MLGSIIVCGWIMNSRNVIKEPTNWHEAWIPHHDKLEHVMMSWTKLKEETYMLQGSIISLYQWTQIINLAKKLFFVKLINVQFDNFWLTPLVDNVTQYLFHCQDSKQLQPKPGNQYTGRKRTLELQCKKMKQIERI